MDDIISKILEMDETARKLDDETQAEKIASRDEVMSKRKEVYEHYLSSAKDHIDSFKLAAKKSSDEKWKKTEAHYKKISSSLDETFEKNKDKWIDDIVSGVISGK